MLLLLLLSVFVDSHVLGQVSILSERFVSIFSDIGLFASVDPHVVEQVPRFSEFLSTIVNGALKASFQTIEI